MLFLFNKPESGARGVDVRIDVEDRLSMNRGRSRQIHQRTIQGQKTKRRN